MGTGRAPQTVGNDSHPLQLHSASASMLIVRKCLKKWRPDLKPEGPKGEFVDGSACQYFIPHHIYNNIKYSRFIKH